MAANKEHNV